MHRAAALSALLIVLAASSAHAGVFDPPGPLTTRMTKPGDGPMFQLGLHVESAPIRALAQQQIKRIAESHPEFEQVMDLVGEVDPELIEGVDMPEIKQQLLDLPGVTDDPQLVEAIDKLPNDNRARDRFLTVVDLMQEKEKAIVFALRPYLQIDFSALMATVEVPFAGFKTDEETSYMMGNVNLDLSLSKVWETSVVGFGLGGGLHLYAPTAGERANVLTHANVLHAPTYLREYLTAAPYVSATAEVAIVRVTAHAELVPMFAVRGDARRGAMRYGRYGLAGQVLLGPFKLNAELAGTRSLKDAEALEANYATGAFALDLGFLHLAVGVQVPISKKEGASAAGVGGVDAGEPGDFNIHARAALGF